MMNTMSQSLGPFREIWSSLASNQRYRHLVQESDIPHFLYRVDTEGLDFLTVSLPSLGKALDTYHATKVWRTPDQFQTDGNGLPTFLGRAVQRSLEGQSLAVDCVRQLSYLFYKLEVSYDPETVDRFLSDFKRIDEELGFIDWENNSLLLNEASLFIRRILCNEDPTDIRPCHGSGATACRTVNHEKWHRLRYYPKLDSYFSYPDYFFFSPTHLADELAKLEKAEVAIPRARVCLVPKDSRGPRIISCEPAELMYIQQGLMRKLYRALSNHPLTRGRVNFLDQETNRMLACESSITGEHATMDLSEASDRVSLELVKRLFPYDWFKALEACRSESTVLPNGEEIKLNKFAPMGSSCCFPVEALVFYSIASVAIRQHKGFRPDVYVYGDDIIVGTDQVPIVIEAFERVGLKVNSNKTFASGFFRESCGGDYHFGTDVTPVRIRKFPASSSSSIVTDADLCNNFIAKFGYEDSIKVISVIESLHRQPFPRSLMPQPGCILAEPRASNDCFYQRRYNKYLQRYEHRIPGLYVKALAYHKPSWSELLRRELTRDIRDNDDPDKYANPLRKLEAALEPGYYADVHSARIKWTWTWLG